MSRSTDALPRREPMPQPFAWSWAGLAFVEDRYRLLAPPASACSMMAANDGRVGALDLRRALTQTPNVDAIVGRLLERGLICRPSPGRYDFALPLFGVHLRRRANLARLARGRQP